MGEAVRRRDVAKYLQCEDRGRLTLLRPTLEGIWRGTLSRTELICEPQIRAEDIPVGHTALLVLSGDGARIISGNRYLGFVTPGSMALLKAVIGDDAHGCGSVLKVEIVRIGEIAREFTVKVVPEVDDAA